MNSSAWTAALLASCLLLVPRVLAERIFPVTGVVRAPLNGDRIVVTHEEIVGYMPAMTMAFTVAPVARAAAAKLQVGDRVRGSLHVDAEHAAVDGLEVLGPAAPAGAPAVGLAVPRIDRVREGDPVPAFSLVDQAGRPFTAAALTGQVTILTFIFTRCPVPEYCPLMARRFAELQRTIEADPGLAGRARLVSVTLDPEFDRPAVLRAYGEAVGAHPAIWSFATGAPADVTRLVTAFSVYTERNGAVLDHTLCTALIDSTGRIVTLWRGNRWTTAEVIAAARVAK